MKVNLIVDEWYPVYTITKSDYCNAQVNLSKSTIKRINAATREFERAQKLLSRHYKKSHQP